MQNPIKSTSDSTAFLAWATQYDDPNFTGRSIKIHRDWLALLSCETLMIDSSLPLETNVLKVLQKIGVAL